MYQAQLVGAPGAGRFDLLKDFFHIHSKTLLYDLKYWSGILAASGKPGLIHIGIIRMQPKRGDFSSGVKFVPGINAVGIPCERQTYQQGSVLIRDKLGFFDGIDRADMLRPPSAAGLGGTADISKLPLRGIVVPCGYFMSDTQFITPRRNQRTYCSYRCYSYHS